jgi:uncharacterized coiled-coil protein SlyX
MNDRPDPTGARIDALETLFAHQEKLLAELNEVVAAQWRKIDALERRIVQMREEMHMIAPARDLPEPPPPHY